VERGARHNAGFYQAAIGKVLESVFEQDYVTVAPVKDAGVAEFVGKDLKAAIADLEKRMRCRGRSGVRGGRAAARRIRRLEALDLDWNRRRRRVPRCVTAPHRAEARPHAGADGAGRWRLRSIQAARAGRMRRRGP
jgi:excinuclease ABC subunit B